MSMIQSASITPVLAAGSTASPYAYQVNITQRLCCSSCAESEPVFQPTMTLQGTSLVSSGLYMATILVQGIISYIPCGKGACCTKQQLVSQSFSVPIASTTAPTITLATGTAVNAVVAAGCSNCSRTFVSEVPMTITVATA